MLRKQTSVEWLCPSATHSPRFFTSTPHPTLHSFIALLCLCVCVHSPLAASRQLIHSCQPPPSFKISLGFWAISNDAKKPLVCGRVLPYSNSSTHIPQGERRNCAKNPFLCGRKLPPSIKKLTPSREFFEININSLFLFSVPIKNSINSPSNKFTSFFSFSKMNPILREARSSPYIGTQPEGHNSNNNGNEDNERANGRNRMNNAVSDEQFGKVFESVLFNAGSSSSSTDLQFYSDSLGNMETLKEWAKLHEKQRHSSDARGHEHQQRTTGERCTTKAESADNLAESGGGGQSSEQISMMGMECAECAGPTEGSNFLGKHRSETNLPGKAAREGGFHLLEKCCSVELSPAKFMVPPSRLARSKEMPNIADVDDLESCDL